MNPILIPSAPSSRPHTNPPYLLHQKVLKRQKENPERVFLPRNRAISIPRIKDHCFSFSALDHRMKALTKGFQGSQTQIRSPKQRLSILNIPVLKESSERKKRDLLSLTGSLNWANLKGLMDYSSGKAPPPVYYDLPLENGAFKNYKYKQPDILCKQVFLNEKPSKKTFISSNRMLEACMESIKQAPLIKPQINESYPLAKSNLQRNLQICFEESLLEIEEFLLNPLYFPLKNPLKKPLLQNPSNVIEEIAPNRDNITVLLASGSCKEPFMVKECLLLHNMSEKALKRVKTPTNTLLKAHTILLSVLKHCFSGFRTRNRLIRDRILLALGLNPLNPLEIINLKDYFKLVRLFYVMDHSQKELVEFAMGYFRVEKSEILYKEEFFRLLKALTEQVDNRLEEGEKGRKKSLFENFLENYYMTGVLTKENKIVDFQRFKAVYLGYQMNIYDIIDLIFGRI